MKLLVFTSTRADYGILRPLLNLLDADEKIQLELLVTGTHLSTAHGLTRKEIVSDGYEISYDAAILPEGDDGWRRTVSALSIALDEYGSAICALEPDAALVLGDRYEAFAFASVCYLARVPLVHLHGGEVTVGAADEGFRHSITKLSNVHLVAAEEFRDRVIQLGESPESVHNIGALGLDAIRVALGGQRLNRNETALVTYHPATLLDEDPGLMVEAIVGGCLMAGMPRIVLTLPNADHGASRIRTALRQFESEPSIEIHESLGSARYLRELATCRVVLGNSSSGIIEAPFLGTPTINIGGRQDGRPRSPSVIDLANPTVSEVSDSIHRVVSLKLREPFMPTIYGDGHSAQRALELVRGLDLNAGAKRFRDLGRTANA